MNSFMKTFIATFSFMMSSANATTCRDGWESPSTGRGTCSHHGGIADFQSYIPNFSYHEPSMNTWNLSNRAINSSTIFYSAFLEKTGTETSFGYSCVSQNGKYDGAVIAIRLSGDWKNFKTDLINKANPAFQGNNLEVYLVSGNHKTAIKNWRIIHDIYNNSNHDDVLTLSKAIDHKNIYRHAEGIEWSVSDGDVLLTQNEFNLFKTSDYLIVKSEGRLYKFDLSGSFSIISETHSKCVR
jgi:hypothetical protein